MASSLAGRVCLVTGGSRGIGRGIALQLGGAGATVYVTGRTADALDEVAAEIERRGGGCVPVVVDHAKDAEVRGLFERIEREQQGKLDVVVNNAYAAVNYLMENTGKKFYELDPVEAWDTINNVGLRNHYLCTTYASRIMIPRKSGLIVNVSSAGGLMYLFNVAYGSGKAALDKMSHDCAQELKKQNVACVSLWPGPVKTETINEMVLDNPDAPASSKMAFGFGESLEFSGKAVAHLAAQSQAKLMAKTGRILLTADLAREFGFTDVDGTVTGDMRNVKMMLNSAKWTNLAMFVPGFVRVPHFMLYFLGYKF